MSEPPLVATQTHSQSWKFGRGKHRTDGPARVEYFRNLPVRQRAMMISWFFDDRLMRSIWIDSNNKVNLAESVLSQSLHRGRT